MYTPPLVIHRAEILRPRVDREHEHSAEARRVHRRKLTGERRPPGRVGDGIEIAATDLWIGAPRQHTAPERPGEATLDRGGVPLSGMGERAHGQRHPFHRQAIPVQADDVIEHGVNRQPCGGGWS